MIKINNKTILNTLWGGLPDKLLCFPVAMGIASRITKEKDKTTGLTSEERAIALYEFRVNTLVDVLTEAPYMLDLVKLGDLKKEIDEHNKTIEQGLSANAKEIDRAAAEGMVKRDLTPDLLQELKEPFPGYDVLELNPDELKAYFLTEDEEGRKMFSPLVEEVVASFWAWATPRPTVSVSEFMQTK